MQGIIDAAAGTTSSIKKLLVGNLPDSTRTATLKALKEMFTAAGRVLSISILGHGFAFVEMSSADADRALTQFRGHRMGGKVLLLDEAHSRTSSRY